VNANAKLFNKVFPPGLLPTVWAEVRVGILVNHDAFLCVDDQPAFLADLRVITHGILQVVGYRPTHKGGRLDLQVTRHLFYGTGLESLGDVSY